MLYLYLLNILRSIKLKNKMLLFFIFQDIKINIEGNNLILIFNDQDKQDNLKFRINKTEINLISKSNLITENENPETKPKIIFKGIA